MNAAPPIRFLLGPAGSGKTFTCLAEIRAELKRSPDGPPLILLAPKQATYQLERQLLEEGGLQGYTRLHILSFERLATFVLEQLGQPEPELLSEEGRLMLLRALLMQRSKELKIFHATARLPGFAQQLSLLLRELQRHQIGSQQLAKLTERPDASPSLKGKLHDLALLLRAYLEWLEGEKIEDANRLLDIAASALTKAGRAAGTPSLALGGIWMDGFAEMTPQEQGFLAALLPYCPQTTLAFCLDQTPLSEEASDWLSCWALVGRTFAACREKMKVLPECSFKVDLLKRGEQPGRFDKSATLRQLEANWAGSKRALAAPSDFKQALRVVTCINPEAEAVTAAREILKFVRSKELGGQGGRYRDCAVLLRSLDGHHDVVRRIFTRYEIPFFLDHRESAAHHPLAELTRSALRVVAFDWRHEDWFGALKTGLAGATDAVVDALENAALRNGWKGGEFWISSATVSESVRREIVLPFAALKAMTEAAPTGTQLAAALGEFWKALDVEEQLEKWNGAAHATVWRQMQDWSANLARAFSTTAMPLAQWLPVIESGLLSMTIGLVPPALDQVLIGAVDRSRNPNLRLAIVLGMNEGIFPARPAPPILLTEREREKLADAGAQMGPNAYQQIGCERYLGYIACSRASERLVLTSASRGTDGKPCNRSFFLDHLKHLFPDLEVDIAAEETEASWRRQWVVAEHAVELERPLLRNGIDGTRVESLAQLESLDVFCPLREARARLAGLRQAPQLAESLVEKIHGKEIKTSVTALEQFAACPFKFFVSRSLLAEERKEFEVDPREKGNFQHDLLKQFHAAVMESKRQWRDLAPSAASEMVAAIGRELLPKFKNGVFLGSKASEFAGEALIEAVQRLVEVLIGWMPQNRFDPVAVEVGFGLPESPLPAWRLELAGGRALLLRGRIDRVDLCRDGLEEGALVAVFDYKSSGRSLDATKLHNGLELQLLSYLGVLRAVSDAHNPFGVTQLFPAGVFYVSLKNAVHSVRSRSEMLEGTGNKAYQHAGRFNRDVLENFDTRGQVKGDQFRYGINKDGSLSKTGNDALEPVQFDELLAQVEAHLKRHGTGIYSGTVAVTPYRKGKETACDWCEFRGICRFDPWTQRYQVLPLPPKPKKEEKPKKARKGK